MNIEAGANKLAEWLHSIRDQGRPCPTNLTATAVLVLNCTRKIGSDVCRHLKQNRRLVLNPNASLFMIDGKRFGLVPVADENVEAVKQRLRRLYSPVVDVRTVEDETKVATGKPKFLLCGTETIPFSIAEQMAADMVSAAR